MAPRDCIEDWEGPGGAAVATPKRSWLGKLLLSRTIRNEEAALAKLKRRMSAEMRALDALTVEITTPPKPPKLIPPPC